MNPVRIKKTYDVICPYCYLGMTAFEEASRKTGIPIEIEHQPYLLHNGVPEEGVRIGDYLGHLSPEQRASMYAGQQASAQKLDIRIMDGDDLIVRNTIAAHIAIEYAARHGKADEALRAFFKAHFTDQTPIDQAPEVVKILLDVIPDLDTEELIAALKNPDNIERVKAQAADAREAGVRSVPDYTINGVPSGGSLSAEDAAEILNHFARSAA